MCQKSDMKQVPSRVSTNIRCHRTKLRRPCPKTSFNITEKLGLSGLGNTTHRISMSGNVLWRIQYMDLTETDTGLYKITREFNNFK
jgi:hypothetical protein